MVSKLNVLGRSHEGPASSEAGATSGTRTSFPLIYEERLGAEEDMLINGVGEVDLEGSRIGDGLQGVVLLL